MAPGALGGAGGHQQQDLPAVGAPPPQNDQQQPQGSHGQAHPELGEDDEEAAADNDGPAGFSRLSMVHKGLLSWGRGLAEIRKCLPGPNICSR